MASAAASRVGARQQPYGHMRRDCRLSSIRSPINSADGSIASISRMQPRYRPSISGHTLPGQHRPCSMVSKIRTASGDGDVDGPTEEEGFDGEALHDLLFDTYGVSYDVNLVHRKALGFDICCLNVMWKYMGQRTFPLSEQEYFEKLEFLAYALSEWEQTDTVKSFLAKNPRKHPRVSHAISIPLEVSDEDFMKVFGADAGNMSNT